MSDRILYRGICIFFMTSSLLLSLSFLSSCGPPGYMNYYQEPDEQLVPVEEKAVEIPIEKDGEQVPDPYIQ